MSTPADPTQQLATALTDAAALFNQKVTLTAQISSLQSELAAIDAQIKAASNTVGPLTALIQQYTEEL